MTAAAPVDPLDDNPFFVLALPPDASAIDVERAGRKWLSMLELGLAQAAQYDTPRGPRPRTPDHVRRAMQMLLDPRTRLPFEPWARARPVVVAPDVDAGAAAASRAPWPGAAASTWWGRR